MVLNIQNCKGNVICAYTSICPKMSILVFEFEIVYNCLQLKDIYNCICRGFEIWKVSLDYKNSFRQIVKLLHVDFLENFNIGVRLSNILFRVLKSKILTLALELKLHIRGHSSIGKLVYMFSIVSGGIRNSLMSKKTSQDWLFKIHASIEIRLISQFIIWWSLLGE